MDRDLLRNLTFKGINKINQIAPAIQKKKQKKEKIKVDEEEDIYSIISSYKDRLIEAKKSKNNISKKEILHETKKELIDYIKEKYSNRRR